ncbi:S-layer homology domain-containing protein [Inediibacterium massiliense]|uniref:S-layer homology domain-containing protein n=1 Tax=Inediibacterium massiliense TaxID=1658111 RepID=UPI0006B57B8A|nr:S-layer homology domain-containing protein [Inediibacterium massiliense]
MKVGKQKKRDLAMLLVVAMVFSLLPMASPITAEAKETVTGVVYDQVYAVDEIEDIEVDLGTEFKNIGLPEIVTVTLEVYDEKTGQKDYSHKESIKVEWQSEGYKKDQTGTYTLKGELILEGNIKNDDMLMAEVKVIVKAADQPTKPSNEKAIKAFRLNDKYIGRIDEDKKEITVAVNKQENLSNMKTYIEASEGTKVSIGDQAYTDNMEIDFSNPVKITVVAKDDSKAEYTVHVEQKEVVVIDKQTPDENGKIDLDQKLQVKDGKTDPAIVPIEIENLGVIEIKLPALNLGEGEKPVIEIKKPQLNVNRPVNALKVVVTGLAKLENVELNLPIPKELENKAVAGFHDGGAGRWEYREAIRSGNNVIFSTNLSTVLVGEAVYAPEKLEIVRIGRNDVVLKVERNLKAGEKLEFSVNDKKVTAQKVEKGYLITGLSSSTIYKFGVRVIDAEQFESNTITIKGTTLKKSSSSKSSSSGSSTSTSDNTIKASESMTVKEKGVVLDIPSNAMSSDFKVKIEKVSNISKLPMNKNAKFAGDVFEITKDKDGDFKKEVKLILPFDKSKVDFEKYGVSLFWLNEKTDKWIELDHIKVNKSSEEVSGQTDHFTKFAVLAVEKNIEEEKEEEKEKEEIVNVLTDIKGHWAESFINDLVKTKAISGYPDQTFKPDNKITRAEFATVLVKALDLELTSGKVFTDTQNHWAKDYISTAYAKGIVSGYNENTFGANDLITREQMAVMVVKAIGLDQVIGNVSFTDKDQISLWALDAIRVASIQKIVGGYEDNTFRPSNYATRAEAVTVIINAIN